MKFSTFMLVEKPDGKSDAAVLRDAVDHAVYAESLGFDAIWIAEHHFTNYGVVPSPAVLAAAIAAKTKTIKIGSAVSVLPFHDPIRLAEDYAMVDCLSEGRLDFGVGRGYQPHEFKGFNIPMSAARDRFDEALEVIEGLWSHESFSYHGKFFNFDDLKLYPRPVQQPTPPIWVAAVSPETFIKVAKAGRPFLSSPSFTPIEKIKAGFDTYRNTLREHGHQINPILPLQRHVFIGDTKQEAYAKGRDPFMWYLSKNAELMSSADSNDPSYKMYKVAQRNKASADYDDIFNGSATLINTAEVAIERIAHLKSELDLNYMMCSFLYGGMDPELAKLSMRRFAERVIPEFK